MAHRDQVVVELPDIRTGDVGGLRSRRQGPVGGGGNVVKDTELRYSQGGKAIGHVRLAVDNSERTHCPAAAA